MSGEFNKSQVEEPRFHDIATRFAPFVQAAQSTKRRKHKKHHSGHKHQNYKKQSSGHNDKKKPSKIDANSKITKTTQKLNLTLTDKYMKHHKKGTNNTTLN